MKIQQFYIFRFNSSRILNHNFNIELDVEQARINNEIVSVAENQTIRSVFAIRQRNYDPAELRSLFVDKRKIKNKTSSPENIQKIIEIEEKINQILFVPEIISVLVNDKNHYKKIIDNSFFVNGKKFVRLMCGSGHARRNTVIFCDEEVEQDLKKLLNNGRDETVEISENKFNAYFALSFSGTQVVDEPYFTVIPDYEIARTERVDFVVQDNGPEHIEEREMPITFNCFDGMGLVSIEKAKQWAEELELDYVPSNFIVRNAFLKGMVCVFDFHRFSDECGVHKTTDVYGNSVNTRDMDLILTKSMFKGSGFYKSLDEYKQKCRENGMKWGISRFSHEKDDDFVFSNYQFIQNLNLDEEKIERLCKKTIEYFEKTIEADVSYTLLYLLGDMARREYRRDILEKVGDVVSKALLLNNSLISDPYVRSHIIYSLNKKIKESYIGNLLLDGNYSSMIADPYALCEHMFGLPVIGLLARGQHFSNYWNKKGVSQVAAMRAPLTWRSEVNCLNLKNDDQVNFWYQYIQSGTIYNIHGVDTMLAADSDFDGDLIMTTSDPIIIGSIYGGLPITYDKAKPKKKVIIESELWKVDTKAFDSPIGLITNYSTTMYSILQNFEFGSVEYNELIQRLKLCRFFQGEAIDAAKNDSYKKMPDYWSRWSKVKPTMTPEEKELAEFNNRLIIDKRPIFMRHIYTPLNREHSSHRRKYENFSQMMFGRSIEDILENPQTQDEYDCVARYRRFSPVIETGSISNKVCFYLEKRVKEVKAKKENPNKDSNVLLLQDKSIPFDEEKFKKLYDLYKKYKAEKRNFISLVDEDGQMMFKTIEQYNKHVRNEAYKISSDISELANLAVNICYIAHPSDNKNFAWQIFGDGIIQNISRNRQDVLKAPFRDENGDLEYMGCRFSMMEIDGFSTNEDFDYEDIV